jgi:hypothetical protein
LNTSVTTTFCFRSPNSNDNATLRLYKPKGKYEIKQFDRPSISNPEIIFGVNYEDFNSIANRINCNSSEFKGQSIGTDNEESAFVFYNLGTSPVFLNLTTTVKMTNYRASLAIHTSRKVTKFNIDPSMRYIIISKNVSVASSRYENDIIFRIEKISTDGERFTLIIIPCYTLFFLVFITGIYALLFPKLQKWYFKRKNVRSHLGETAVQMLDDARDLKELHETVIELCKEREILVWT